MTPGDITVLAPAIVFGIDCQQQAVQELLGFHEHLISVSYNNQAYMWAGCPGPSLCLFLCWSRGRSRATLLTLGTYRDSSIHKSTSGSGPVMVLLERSAPDEATP